MNYVNYGGFQTAIRCGLSAAIKLPTSHLIVHARIAQSRWMFMGLAVDGEMQNTLAIQDHYE